MSLQIAREIGKIPLELVFFSEDQEKYLYHLPPCVLLKMANILAEKNRFEQKKRAIRGLGRMIFFQHA